MDKKFKYNKKGDVPVMVLIIGVVALCFLTIMSFTFVISQLDKNFYGIQGMEKINSLIEEYQFYRNLGMKNVEIAEFMDEFRTDDGTYFYVEEKGVSGFLDKVRFSVKYYP